MPRGYKGVTDKNTGQTVKRGQGGRFEKGTKPGPGRPKGLLNKFTGDLKEAWRCLSLSWRAPMREPEEKKLPIGLPLPTSPWMGSWTSRTVGRRGRRGFRPCAM